MTKLRAPLSADAAITRAAALIPGSWSEMAELTGRQPWLVRAWGDPDRREQIPLRDALLIDRACREAATETPLADYYLARLGLAAPAAPDTATLSRQAAEVVRECGEASGALFAATREGASAAEASSALRELDQAIGAALRLVPLLERAAGPKGTGPPH